MYKRKPLTDIIIDIKKLLEKEGEFSIRQISIKAKVQWITAVKVVELLKELGVVAEREGTEDDRKTRLFRLKK